MRRASDNKYGYHSWSEEDIKRFAKFLILPLLVIILVIVILIADRKNHQKEESGAEENVQTETESSAGEEPSEEETPASQFSTGQVPEVQALIETYFNAKQNADAEGIYQAFGWTDLTGIDDLRRQLQYDARYTEGYRNITCYVKQGVTEGTYLTYVSYDLKFKDSLTLAPGILWNYIKMGEDGNYYLTASEDLNETELAYIAEAEKADEIVLLKTQIYANLRQALENDEALARSYSILEKQGGASNTKPKETEHEVTIQIGQ